MTTFLQPYSYHPDPRYHHSSMSYHNGLLTSGPTSALTLQEVYSQQTSRVILLTGWSHDVAHLCLKLSNGLPSQDKTQSFYYDLTILNDLTTALCPTSDLIYSSALSSLLQPWQPSCCFSYLRTFAFVWWRMECFSANSSLVDIFSVTLSGYPI